MEGARLEARGQLEKSCSHPGERSRQLGQDGDSKGAGEEAGGLGRYLAGRMMNGLNEQELKEREEAE